ncbi:MAG: flagellar biosynthesis protein FlgN [Rhodobacteraceae bacterium]|nr:flagellar biosynthesis protein FlgN [Paracoccaceae bacterium]
MGNETLDPLERLQVLLRDARGALLDGRLHALALMTEETASCLAALPEVRGPRSAAALDALRLDANENHRLMGAALAGIRAARTRLEAIRKVRGELETYDRHGDKRRVTFGGGNLERRA